MQLGPIERGRDRLQGPRLEASQVGGREVSELNFNGDGSFG